MRKPKVKVDEIDTRDIIRAAPGYYFSDNTMKGFGTRCADTAYVGRGVLFLALNNTKATSSGYGYRVCEVAVSSVEPLVITRCRTVSDAVGFINMKQCRAAARRLAINSPTLVEEAPCTT